MEKDPFEEYIRQSEPDKRRKSYVWSTAIGLQGVDDLKPSDYLYETAVQNIEGKITIEEAGRMIDRYYEENPRSSGENRTEEADKVSARIAAILAEDAFTFSPNEYLSIHRKLFLGIYSHAGKIRDYNITKKEWVLDGASVFYGTASELRATLEYDFSEERKYRYKGRTMDEIIQHLAHFVARLWQIHVFGEGNTRTTAVFFIKYLRQLGFDATNDIFAQNAWYFRNALVRANYSNLREGIYETTEYLERFLKNLLLGSDYELSNRKLHIYANSLVKRVDIGKKDEDEKVDIGQQMERNEDKKVDIEKKTEENEDKKVDIEKKMEENEDKKIDIEKKMKENEDKKIDIQIEKREIEEKTDVGRSEKDMSIYTPDFSNVTITHIKLLYSVFGYEEIFSRNDVTALLKIKNAAASRLLKKMLDAGLTESVKGQGKGKYRFKKKDR